MQTTLCKKQDFLNKNPLGAPEGAPRALLFYRLNQIVPVTVRTLMPGVAV
jgi:hypothetical protein